MSSRRFAASSGQKRFIAQSLQRIASRPIGSAGHVPKAELRELAADAAAKHPVKRVPEAPRR